MGNPSTTALEKQRDTKPEAYQHAPTLIAGHAAGEQGVVRVWAPRKPSMLMPTLGAGLAAIFGFLDVTTLHTELGMTLLLIYAAVFIVWCMTVPQTYYFTTDDAGIGITTRKGSRALRWSEIISCGRGNPSHPLAYRILLQGGEVVEIYLTGHSNKVQHELLSLIDQKTTAALPQAAPSLRPLP